jgi:hypothetical protein
MGADLCRSSYNMIPNDVYLSWKSAGIPGLSGIAQRHRHPRRAKQSDDGSAMEEAIDPPCDNCDDDALKFRSLLPACDWTSP